MVCYNLSSPSHWLHVTSPSFCTTVNEKVYITEGPPILGPAKE
jgi:hypothetical protein